MANYLEGKVVIVTGSGRGIGREVALLAGELGAKVIVNDPGVSVDGSGTDLGPADSVVAEIKAKGGEATADYNAVGTMDAGEAIIKKALDTYGKLDGLVNVAGILRDRMIFNMTEEEWDAVMSTHLKGTFTTTKFASIVLRQQRHGRIVNFSSISGLWGNAGQANYGAAKEGIAGLTRCVARDMGRYGVTCNAIAPLAATRMTATIPGAPGSAVTTSRPRLPNREYFEDMDVPDNSPQHIAPMTCYLLGDPAWDINGQIFQVTGGQVGWLETMYPAEKMIHKDVLRYGPWTLDELGQLVYPMLVSGTRNPSPPPAELPIPGRPVEAAAG